jgi:hypothetical protein
VSADTTSEEALRQLSVHEFHRVVIAVALTLRPASSPPPSASASRPQKSGPKPSASRTPNPQSARGTSHRATRA